MFSNHNMLKFVEEEFSRMIKVCETLNIDSIEKYVYLEKALIAVSKNKKNEGAFTSNDEKNL